MRRHHHVDIPRNTTANCPKCKQIPVCVVWLVAAEYLLKKRGTKGLKHQSSSVAPIQRLRIVEKYLVHEAIYAAVDDKIQLRLVVVLVPDVLYVAVNPWVRAVKLLEFVDDKSVGAFFRLFHQLPKKFAKSCACSVHPKMQNPFRLFLKLGAKRDFWLPCDGQIQVWCLAIVKCLAGKFSLSHSPTASQNRKTRSLLRKFADFSKFFQFDFATKKSHKPTPSPSSLRNVRFVNGCFGCK